MMPMMGAVAADARKGAPPTARPATPAAADFRMERRSISNDMEPSGCGAHRAANLREGGRNPCASSSRLPGARKDGAQGRPDPRPACDSGTSAAFARSLDVGRARWTTDLRPAAWPAHCLANEEPEPPMTIELDITRLHA